MNEDDIRWKLESAYMGSEGNLTQFMGNVKSVIEQAVRTYESEALTAASVKAAAKALDDRAELRKALQWVHQGSICCDPCTAKSEPCLICRVLKETQ